MSKKKLQYARLREGQNSCPICGRVLLEFNSEKGGIVKDCPKCKDVKVIFIIDNNNAETINLISELLSKK